MSLDLVSYLKEKPSIALVGATNDRSKFGNIIFRDMVGKGYDVIPINRRAQSVDAVPAYPDLTAAQREHAIGLVVYVVPPKITRESLEEAKTLGLLKIWVQPGAGDDAVRTFLSENDFEYLIDACVMVEAY